MMWALLPAAATVRAVEAADVPPTAALFATLVSGAAEAQPAIASTLASTVALNTTALRFLCMLKPFISFDRY